MKMMYKVCYIINDKVYDSLFDTKEAAQMFCEAMVNNGCNAIMSKWTWNVNIEE